MRAEQALDGLDVLLLLEPRKGVEVVDRLGEDPSFGKISLLAKRTPSCVGAWRAPAAEEAGCLSLGLIDVLAVVAPLRDERVDDQRGLGEGERLYTLELAELEDVAGLLIAWRRRLGPRGRRLGHADGRVRRGEVERR